MAMTNAELLEGVKLMLAIASMFLAVPMFFLWTEGDRW